QQGRHARRARSRKRPEQVSNGCSRRRAASREGSGEKGRGLSDLHEIALRKTCLMIIAETERLIVRHFHIADGEAMDRVLGDPEVMYFSHGVRTPHEVRAWLSKRLEDYRQLGFGLWAVVEKTGRETIGYCGLSHFPDVGGEEETEIGYRLAREYWGRGLATEA